ncbi:MULTISPECIES: hypothetical protein [unclassified Microbacterium]|uniref:hypothetical protein n=1 Tax=unclassified Microbacterium TaxID=2609290 RepID=UPI001AEE4EBC|nr:MULTISPECIES: hypothetical protein [unclassified Microbacterium]QYM64586.1 hypothetical protein K1X59_01365 [Microbacterium sp. Se5.02b]
MAAIVLSAIAATATSCTPDFDKSTSPDFALTSAEVVFAAGHPYPVNFIFVAPESDAIWTDLTGVELPGDASVGPGEFDVIRGAVVDGYQLGNITFEITIPADGIAFESIGLVYAHSTEPEYVDVGSWTLTEARPEEFATADARAEVTAMSECTRAELPVPHPLASVGKFRTGSSAVSAEDVALAPDRGAIDIALSCTDDADFYVISPTLDYTDTEGTEKSTRLAPIAIGYQDIDDADFRRIRQR